MPEIPLRRIIEAWRQQHPEFSQARLAFELGLHPSSFSLLLNHERYPRKTVIPHFQNAIIEKLKMLGLPVLEPAAANFSGIKESGNEFGHYPRARWLCLEAGISCREIGREAGLPRSVVNDYLLGRLPWKPSAGKVDFLDALPRILGRYFAPGDLEDLWGVLSQKEYEAERQKRKEGERNNMLTQEALKFYKWDRNPFAVDEPLKPGELYFSEAHREILDRLLQAAQGRKFFVVFGETGAGKSMLLKKAKELLRRIPLSEKDRIFSLEEIENFQRISEGERAYLIVEPAKEMAQMAAANNFLNLLLGELGIGNLTQDGLRKAVLLKDALTKRKQKVVLMIDEGNQMHPDTLRSLKAFFELEDEELYTRLLSVVVAGQPVGLEDKMQFLATLKEVYLRATQDMLGYLKNGDGEAFIESRLALMGQKPKDVFTEEALKAILDKADRFGGSTPARINKVITAALNRKFILNPNAKLVGIDEVVV